MVDLTKAAIKRLPRPAKGNKIYYDDTVPGFGCRVTAAGGRSYVLNYTTKSGRDRRITIGKCVDWDTTAARARARELRRGTKPGELPKSGATPAVRSAVPEDDDMAEIEALLRKRGIT